MPPPATNPASRVLSPTERFSEIIFGLIMVLSFTCAISVATGGREDVREMLIGAIGCNLAWAIVDALMYLLNALAERGRAITLLRAVRRTTDAAPAHQLIADALPPLVASVMRESDFDYLRGQLTGLADPPPRPWLTGRDWRGAAGVFLLVFLSTFPVVIPFMLISSAPLAMGVSHGVAIVMLFAAGYRLALYAGTRPVRTGMVMVAIGAALVLVTLALGG